MSGTTKLALVGDTFDRSNWGCRATSGALRTMLSAVAELETTIDYRELRWRTQPGFRAIDRPRAADAGLRIRVPDPALVTDTGRGSVLRRVGRFARWKASEQSRYRSSFVPASADAFDETWRVWSRHDVVRDWVDGIRAADGVIVNGEGSVRANSTSGRFSFFLAWVAKTQFDKSVAIVNHMCDLADPAMRGVAELVYPLVDQVVVRGSASFAEAARCCPADRLTLAPDAAFRHRPAPTDAFRQVCGRRGYFDVYPLSTADFDPSEPYVCIGGSAAYQDGSTVTPETLAWFEELATTLRRERQVVLLGHDYPDHVMFEHLGRAHDLPFLGLQTPIPQVVDVLGHAAAYAGGRWHSSVLAAAGGTPFLRLSSNSDVKSRDLDDFRIGGGDETLSLVHRPPVDDVVEAIERLVKAGAELRDEARQRADEYEHRALDQCAFAIAP